ncbi:MAG: LysR family transcriptional regulator [Firmicutes bacterium]|nr:LysR family transcriptional regulator [Bacillota bacterium]
MPDLRYNAFLRVAETGSITKAAERLHYTQPGISKLLSSLEEEFGVQLFYRGKGGSVLTPCGEAVLPHLRDMEHCAWQAMEAAKEFVNINKDHMHVGSFTGATLRWIPDLLKVCAGSHPRIKIDIINKGGEGLEQDLLANKYDFAFVPFAAHKELDIVYLTSDPYVAILPEGHRLADREKIRAEDLKDEDIILPSETSCEEVLSALRLMKIPHRILFKMNDDLAAVEMVRTGAGVSFLPSMVLGSSVHSGVRAVPIADVKRDIGLAKPKRKHEYPTTAEFWKICVEMFKAE